MIFSLLLSTALHAGADASEGAKESKLITTMGPVVVGKPCPAWGGVALDGAPVSLQGLLDPKLGGGKGPIVLSFAASWCHSCRAHLPAMMKVIDDKKDKLAARLVLIDFAESVDETTKFVNELNIVATSIVPDSYARIGKRLGVGAALPRTLVLDKDGIVRAIFEIEGESFAADLARELTAASLPLK